VRAHQAGEQLLLAAGVLKEELRQRLGFVRRTDVRDEGANGLVQLAHSLGLFGVDRRGRRQGRSVGGSEMKGSRG
jgi:hypothetical protein